TLSGGFIGDGGVVAIGIIALVGVTFGFAFTFGCTVGLDAATRALGELALYFLDRFGLGRVLNHRDFAGETIERRFIELAFAVGLFGLRLRTIEIANDFRDRDDIAGIDLCFVFLGAAGPHGALDARTALQRLQRLLDQRGLGQLAH